MMKLYVLIGEAQFVSYEINVPWYVKIGVVLLAVTIILTVGKNPRSKRKAPNNETEPSANR